MFDRRCIPAEPRRFDVAHRCAPVERHGVFLPRAPCPPGAAHRPGSPGWGPRSLAPPWSAAAPHQASSPGGGLGTRATPCQPDASPASSPGGGLGTRATLSIRLLAEGFPVGLWSRITMAQRCRRGSFRPSLSCEPMPRSRREVWGMIRDDPGASVCRRRVTRRRGSRVCATVAIQHGQAGGLELRNLYALHGPILLSVHSYGHFEFPFRR